MTLRFLFSLVASCLLLLTGCKETTEASGGTSGAALYAYDSTTSQVFVWKDLGTLYDSTATLAPTYRISSSLFTKVTALAWGGVCFDSQRGVLYLVSETGTIVRVSSIRTQTGSVPSAEVVSFALSNTGRLTNVKFGQVALDSQNNTLYITENGDSSTQIWVVSGASSQGQDASVTLQALQNTSDSGGTGVVAASGVVYGFFLDGGTVGIESLTGPRLRRGNASAFGSTDVILGSLTTLGKYGVLALDTANGYLFVGRHNTDAASTAAPIQVFRTGQFGLSYNQAPYLTLGSATGQPDLRVLTHAGNRDWLVGLKGTGTVGAGTFYVWKQPMAGSAAKSILAPTGSVVKGVAIDGNAS
ncbi:MAG: hypothetical protein NTW40_15200 [Acidobacteria bacterium]|nr:hypothetical protein [Acidobacteriota bacterium]